MAKSDINIKETVDGRPLDEVMSEKSAETRRERRSKDMPIKRPKGDPYIWGLYILLIIVSIIELYSASSAEVKSDSIYGPLLIHVRYLILGFLLILGCQHLHYKWFLKLAWVFAILCLVGVLVAYVFGVNYNGAQRALRIAGFTVQPSEFLKLAIVLLLARILAKNQVSGGVSWKGVILSSVVTIVACGAVYKNGLTNMLLVMGSYLILLVISGTSKSKIAVILLTYCTLGGCVYFVQFRDKPKEDNFDTPKIEQSAEDNTDRTVTRKNRIQRFIAGVHPNDTIDDLNYQVMHANFAMAHGGIGGNGPGNSRESSRLPLAFSDYIFSIVVEDMGVVGGVVLLLVYLGLVARAGTVASKCSRAFPALLIMGCAVVIVFQALMHMAIVVGLFPVSGQPLPFISKGGTSVLVMSLAIGMMLSVSRYAVRTNSKKDINQELKELPDDITSENPMKID
jgi:cell division protein FtsW